jgi:hypothetical protein
MCQPAEGTGSILYRISRKKPPASRGNIADGTKRRFGFCREEHYFLGKNFIFQERTLFFIYNGSVSITLFFCLLSIFLNPVRL